MFTLLVGTYTRETHSEGIYGFSVAEDFATINHISENVGIDNPSYLAAHPTLNVVYGVNEVSDFATGIGTTEESSGAISAFSHENGQLTLINQQKTWGADPCHINVAASGRFLLVSNYSGGSLVSIFLLDDGSLGEVQSKVQHAGEGFEQPRQGAAHVHSTAISLSGKFSYTADLGLDQLVRYKINEAGLIDQADPCVIPITAGAGPRHFCFSGNYVYLFNELNNTICSLILDEDEGLQVVATCSSLPKNYTGKSDGAHIATSIDGRFLYVTNRGSDSIGVFSIETGGRLNAIQFQESLGQHPRHFSFSPDERYLLVANRDTNDIRVFCRDEVTGLLEWSGFKIDVPAPVFLLTV